MFTLNFSTLHSSASLFAASPPERLGTVTTLRQQLLSENLTTQVNLPLPAFLRRWNVTGAIAISRQFQSIPRTSAIFYACAEDECAIRLALPNGKKVNLFGMAFRITSFNSSPIAPESEQIKIELQLSGIHDSYGEPSRNPLDQPSQG